MTDENTSAIEQLAEAMRDSDRLEVILHELRECRADDRDSLSAMVGLLAAITALYGAFFFLILSERAGEVEWWVWAFLPLLPFGLAGWMIYVGTLVSLRGEYMVQLERFLARNKMTVDVEGLPVPRYAHLSAPFVRIGSRGEWRTRVLLLIGLGILFGLLLSLTIVSILRIDNAGKEWLVGFCYVPLFGFMVYRVMQNFAGHESLWNMAKESAEK